MKIVVKNPKGFNKTKQYFNNALEINKLKKINRILDKAIDKLKKVSPSITVANAWSYEINDTLKGKKISISNSAIKDGENLAILEDVGYVSSEGIWISGKNYLKKTTDSIYKDIIQETWRELKNL